MTHQIINIKTLINTPVKTISFSSASHAELQIIKEVSNNWDNHLQECVNGTMADK